MVMRVLLKVALIWAMPSASTTFFVRLVRCFGFATRIFLGPLVQSINNGNRGRDLVA
jgi:ABC-type Na+ efflux pump permease subunit